MTRLTRLCRAVGVGLAVAATTLSVTGVAHAEPAPPNLGSAPAIAVPAGNKVFLVGKVSTGVQIYKCTAAGWTFDHPEATLVGDNGKEIIKHFAGPTWQAKDGSTVKAAVQEPRGPGDRLAHTTYIQRVNTGGGVAPTSGCDASTVGKEARVGYTADYYFWKATGPGAP